MNNITNDIFMPRNFENFFSEEPNTIIYYIYIWGLVIGFFNTILLCCRLGYIVNFIDRYEEIIYKPECAKCFVYFKSFYDIILGCLPIYLFSTQKMDLTKTQDILVITSFPLIWLFGVLPNLYFIRAMSFPYLKLCSKKQFYTICFMFTYLINISFHLFVINWLLNIYQLSVCNSNYLLSGFILHTGISILYKKFYYQTGRYVNKTCVCITTQSRFHILVIILQYVMFFVSLLKIINIYTLGINNFDSCEMYSSTGNLITLTYISSTTLLIYIPTVKCCSEEEMINAHNQREREAIYEHREVTNLEDTLKNPKIISCSI